jgi:hypothetical protein
VAEHNRNLWCVGRRADSGRLRRRRAPARYRSGHHCARAVHRAGRQRSLRESGYECDRVAASVRSAATGSRTQSPTRAHPEPDSRGLDPTDHRAGTPCGRRIHPAAPTASPRTRPFGVRHPLFVAPCDQQVGGPSPEPVTERSCPCAVRDFCEFPATSAPRADRRIRLRCVPARPLFTHIWGQLCGWMSTDPWTDRASPVDNRCSSLGQIGLRGVHPPRRGSAHRRSPGCLHRTPHPATCENTVHPHCAQALVLLLEFSSS